MEITQNNIAEFALYLKGGEKSENTVKKYVRDIKAFFAWCDGRSVDKEVMLSYKKRLIEKYAPVSVNCGNIIAELLSGFYESTRFKIENR